MASSLLSFDFFKKNSGYFALFMRILCGIYLIYGTQDNVFSYDRMLEFRGFLEVHHFPFPLFCAFLSVIVQFAGGILLILGAWVRPVAVLLMINFIVAIVGVHLDDPYERYAPALQLIFASLFFLFHGAGKLSVDEWMAKKR